MEDTRLPKCVMFGEMVGGAGCVVDQEKSGWGVSWTTSELSASTPTRDEGEWRRTAEQGAEHYRRNRSLQRRPRLDYGMLQWYART